MAGTAAIGAVVHVRHGAGNYEIRTVMSSATQDLEPTSGIMVATRHATFCRAQRTSSVVTLLILWRETRH